MSSFPTLSVARSRRWRADARLTPQLSCHGRGFSISSGEDDSEPSLVAHHPVTELPFRPEVNVSIRYREWPVFNCRSMAGFGCPPGGHATHRDDRPNGNAARHDADDGTRI